MTKRTSTTEPAVPNTEQDEVKPALFDPRCVVQDERLRDERFTVSDPSGNRHDLFPGQR